MPRIPATLRALQYRNFQLFFSGQLISLIGTWMQNLAQAWLVYRLTGSMVLLGAVGFCSQIPIFFLAPLGGIVADQYSRQRVVIATQTSAMLLALALAALTLSGTVRIWHIFVLSALLGAVNAFDIPARQSFIVEMVGKADLMNAIALNSSMFNASRVLGPAIAGILVAVIGEGWCFFANGISYIAVIVGLALMRVAPRPAAPQSGSPVANIVEGFRFVIRHPAIHALLILLGVASVTGMPFTVLMPVFADRILHGGPKALGWLTGSAGVGALASALLLASRQTLKGLGGWIATSSTAFGAGLVIFAAYQFRVRQVRSRFEAVLEERSRLAREMHDTVIQGCTGVSALIEALSMENTGKDDSTGLLDFARLQLRATINEAREAIWNLRQSDDDTGSIGERIEKMTVQVSTEFNIPVSFALTGTPFGLSHPIAHDLLMVAREAVFNAVLHGAPAHVNVALEYTHSDLTLAVADDGCGFDSELMERQRGHHFGLRGMRERVARCGGVFNLATVVGQGVRVDVRLPRNR